MKGPQPPVPPPSRFLSAGVTERLQLLLGQRIKQRRKEMRLTQAKLAEHVSMTRAALASIEIGRQRTSVIALARLAHILEIPPGYLIPDLSEVVEQWDERQRVSIPQESPMLEKELREYNISPEKNMGLDQALADIRATRE